MHTGAPMPLRIQLPLHTTDTTGIATIEHAHALEGATTASHSHQCHAPTTGRQLPARQAPPPAPSTLHTVHQLLITHPLNDAPAQAAAGVQGPQRLPALLTQVVPSTIIQAQAQLAQRCAGGVVRQYARHISSLQSGQVQLSDAKADSGQGLLGPRQLINPVLVTP